MTSQDQRKIHRGLHSNRRLGLSSRRPVCLAPVPVHAVRCRYSPACHVLLASLLQQLQVAQVELVAEQHRVGGAQHVRERAAEEEQVFVGGGQAAAAQLQRKRGWVCRQGTGMRLK